MILEIYKKGEIKFISPKNERDELLFMHCAKGVPSATIISFEFTVKPLLFIHGISTITIIDTTAQPPTQECEYYLT